MSNEGVMPLAKGFVIAGPASGVGKTTVTLGLMAALKRRGLIVQPFKCGPDFIDPGHHTRVCGRASRNLDGWMLPLDRNRALFLDHLSTADIGIVEGVMGLFDGSGQSARAGSTAEIAQLLGLPIVLVVDASAMAASAAASGRSDRRCARHASRRASRRACARGRASARACGDAWRAGCRHRYSARSRVLLLLRGQR
jgi:hypothetical protein